MCRRLEDFSNIVAIGVVRFKIPKVVCVVSICCECPLDRASFLVDSIELAPQRSDINGCRRKRTASEDVELDVGPPLLLAGQRVKCQQKPVVGSANVQN